MPVLRKSRWELFAQNIASGLSPKESILQAGYKSRNAATQASLLQQNPEIAQRIAELLTERKQQMQQLAFDRAANTIADANYRIKCKAERHSALQAIIVERAEFYSNGHQASDQPGMRSGYFVHRIRQMRIAEKVHGIATGRMTWTSILETELDSATLHEMRALEEEIRRELGDGESEVGPMLQQNVQVLVMGLPSDATC